MRNFCEQINLDLLFDQQGKIWLLEIGEGPGGFAAGHGISQELVDRRVDYTRLHEQRFYYHTPRKKRFCIDLQRLANKRQTYRILGDLQPPTFIRGVTLEESFKSWVERQTCDYLVFKNPLANATAMMEFRSRLEVIEALERGEALPTQDVCLAQVFIPSKHYLAGDGEARFGCMRLVASVRCLDNKFDLLFSWPYIRTAPQPAKNGPGKPSMASGITIGGFYLDPDENDRQRAYAYSWGPILRIIRQAINEPNLKIEQPPFKTLEK